MFENSSASFSDPKSIIFKLILVNGFSNDDPGIVNEHMVERYLGSSAAGFEFQRSLCTNGIQNDGDWLVK